MGRPGKHHHVSQVATSRQREGCGWFQKPSSPSWLFNPGPVKVLLSSPPKPKRRCRLSLNHTWTWTWTWTWTMFCFSQHPPCLTQCLEMRTKEGMLLEQFPHPMSSLQGAAAGRRGVRTLVGGSPGHTDFQGSSWG